MYDPVEKFLKIKIVPKLTFCVSRGAKFESNLTALFSPF